MHQTREIMNARHIIVVVLLALLVGCGSSDRPLTVPVEGTVTLAGKAWPAEGRLYFLPTKPAEGFKLKPGVGRFDKNGKFVAGSFEDADGLVPGTYGIRVECWKVPPTVDGPPAVSHVDPRYFKPASSGLTLEVPPDGGPIEVSWDITPAGARRSL